MYMSYLTRHNPGHTLRRKVDNADSFRAVVYLHHLLKEEDLAWLRTLYPEKLPADAEKILIYARETGAVDNISCRELTGLDTLQASALLRRLRQMGLLEKQAGGSRTYYTLAEDSTETPTLWDFASAIAGGKPTNLGEKPPNLEALPPELAARVTALTGRRVTGDNIRELLLALCSISPYTIDELVGLLRKNRDYMMRAFIRPMVRSGELAMRYPESPNHPYQAYVVPRKGKSD